HPLTGLSKLPQLIKEYGHSYPQTLGLELDVLPVANFRRYQRYFPQTEMVDISYDLRLLRAVKSPWEIAQIEKTGEIYKELMKYIPTVLRPGMTEIELEGLIEWKARTLGHETMLRTRAFNFEFHFGGVVAGPQGAIPTYFNGPVGGLGASFAHPLGPSANPIKEGDMVMIDLALAFNGYQIDTTRMAVIGEPSPKLLEAYAYTLQIEELIRLALVPGRVIGEIYDEILEWVRRETPYENNFMGYGSSRVPFVGHGIGLELDELPTISKGANITLAPGMVISVEPKFIFPGEGAIGVEDTLVVEGEEGARFLCDCPRDIIIISP
ncbi:MAG: aminopeptidase P family protein, partial [Desulfitobacterium sp.]|nr:aminopeptidase P family protein [Desulfitobacterium sp.]